MSSSAVVLCIDDNLRFMEHRRATLEAKGYRVDIALSGDEAINKLNRTPVGAVLLEYKSEGLDAEGIACQIKQQFPDLPVILISTCCDIPERILWLVDEYVMRSELPEGLPRIVQRTTQSAKAHAA